MVPMLWVADMILGLVAAKAGSKRFPNKNRYPYHGVPLFWHAVQPLVDCQFVDEIRVITNDPTIAEYTTEHEIGVIPYPQHAIDNHTAPLLDVWRYAYQSVDEICEMVVCIMANCPGHESSEVCQAIGMMRSGHFWEIRSFGDSGEESGLIVLAPHVIGEQRQVSSHLGAIRDEAFEIHHLEDVE